MKTKSLFLILLASLLAACQPAPAVQAPAEPAAPAPGMADNGVRYLDASLTPQERARDLLARMTLEEKIGQMTLVEKNSMPEADVTRYFIGGVLSGGGGSPSPNTVERWAKMVDDYQRAALMTRLAIPVIYGVDAVHGHGNLKGAVIFPHNIGLGATRDAELVARVARATAAEMVATNIRWNFAPVVAVPQDIRWGRTYEGFSEDTELVTRLGVGYLEGLQGE
ncbi:MAG TPA: glycoside hydrolase family 3 N-terminal domain-containing protein, partial [Levilinea sp.]|nr:glycoside hydrolase family 3 N-terminal domain-containing protein [Levilinea sp.]